MNNQRIAHIRLINGEELIGKVIVEKSQSIIIDDPLAIVSTIDKSNQTGVILNRFVPWSKKQQVEISKFHIITITDIHPTVVQYYNNSLQYANQTSDKMLRELTHVNKMMESLSDRFDIEQYEFDNNKYVHQGSVANN